MARFPHEFTMKKYNLIEADLNDDSSDALQDFELHLSHLTDLKSKAGDEWSMTTEQQKKINRLSRAVCMEIEYMVDEAPAEIKEEPVEIKEEPVEIKKAVVDEKVTPKIKEEKKPENNSAGDSPFDFFGFS